MNFPFKPFAHLQFTQALNTTIQYNLSDSCAESLSVQQLLDLETDQSFLKQPLTYASIQGDERLREEIAVATSHQYQSMHVSLYSGVQEAIFCALNAILTDGGEVIAIKPCYPSLVEICHQLGAKLHIIEPKFEQQWNLELSDFTQFINTKTRLIILNSPHNPTGMVIDDSIQYALIEASVKNSYTVLLDEVSVWTHPQTPNAKLLPNNHKTDTLKNILRLGVMSKSLGLPGIRIGWAVTQNAKLQARMLEIKSYLSICCSRTDEQFARIAFKHRQKILEHNNQIVEDNKKLFNSFVKKHQRVLAWHTPKAGLLSLLRIEQRLTPTKFSTELAQKYQLLLLPSQLFGLDGPYYRLGLGKSNFVDALNVFEKAMILAK